jgi:hypothetical protein
MPTGHIIQAGDWLGELAQRYGLGHWSHIWNDAANAELKQLRKTPDLLMVGDLVQIPDEAPPEIQVAAGRRAVFLMRASDAVLRIRVAGLARFIEFFGPIEYELTLGDTAIRGNLTEDGQVLEVELHDDVRTGTLVLMGAQRFDLTVGGLGPATEPRGALARLENLGFVAELRDPQSSGDEPSVGAVDPLTAALVAFQERMGLMPSGRLDDDTTRALVDSYGA